MKIPVIFICCIFLFFTGCKKDNNVAPENTISASIDGVDESFNTNAVAQLGTTVKLNSNLAIYGTNGSAADDDVISITLAVNQTIAPGSFVSGSNEVGLVSILYKHGPVSLINPNTYATDINGSPSTVVITKLTNTNVQGTFSGKLIYRNASKVVTNGKFNLTIK
ncbi:MAG: hypothetical protein ABIN13_05870 [Mucilaginibacter sp.]